MMGKKKQKPKVPKWEIQTAETHSRRTSICYDGHVVLTFKRVAGSDRVFVNSNYHEPLYEPGRVYPIPEPPRNVPIERLRDALAVIQQDIAGS